MKGAVGGNLPNTVALTLLACQYSLLQEVTQL